MERRSPTGNMFQTEEGEPIDTVYDGRDTENGIETHPPKRETRPKQNPTFAFTACTDI
jgi:hypothetical protein